MNIFVLDKDPIVAAQSQHNKHVVKMVVETTQLLSTSLRLLCGPHATTMLYRSTHTRHPCAIWTSSEAQNMEWLLAHGKALLAEYTHRYGKIHKSTVILEEATKLFSTVSPSAWTHELSTRPQCMPDEYRCDDTVTAYRRYYIACKLTPGGRSASWKHREIPAWIPILP